MPEHRDEEFDTAVDKLQVKNTAPGLDGVYGRVLVLPIDVLGKRLQRLFSSSAYLDLERFPGVCENNRFVLLKKEGCPAESPFAYHLIVLLGEARKLFERIISDALSSA